MDQRDAFRLVKPDAVNLLIVDDRPDGLLALEATLDSPEYNLYKAGSGQEALDRLSETSFAAVLLDVQMPDMDGFETARRIRQNGLTRETPIIFITAISKEIRHVHQGYAAGAVDYLFKPFDPEVLRAKVAVFAELYRKNAKLRVQARKLLESERRERERRLAEAELDSMRRYRTLADSVPHIVFRADSEGIPEYFNQKWFDYTGLALSPDDKHQDWVSALHASDAPRFAEEWRNARAVQAPFEAECRVRHAPSGVYRWHMVRLVPERIGIGPVTGWIGTLTDIHERRQTQQELELMVLDRTLELSNANESLRKEMQERLRAEKEMIEISGREQMRIGQDLHDGVSQILTGISYMLKGLERKIQADSPAQRDLVEISALVRRAISDIKSLSRSLHPVELEQHGLVPALFELAANSSRLFQVDCRAECDDVVEVERTAATHLYRIVQEAIHNAVKHGRAKSIRVLLSETAGKIQLSIGDDGKGIADPQKSEIAGMGLRNMRYRAQIIGAALEIRSSNAGTLVLCGLPSRGQASAAPAVRQTSVNA